MKIRENVKEFIVKHHKAICVTSHICIGIGAAGIGYIIGEHCTFGRFKNLTNIDLIKDYGFCGGEVVLKDVWPKDSLDDVLKDIGFTSLEEVTKAAIFIQK